MSKWLIIKVGWWLCFLADWILIDRYDSTDPMLSNILFYPSILNVSFIVTLQSVGLLQDIRKCILHVTCPQLASPALCVASFTWGYCLSPVSWLCFPGLRGRTDLTRLYSQDWTLCQPHDATSSQNSPSSYTVQNYKWNNSLSPASTRYNFTASPLLLSYHLPGVSHQRLITIQTCPRLLYDIQ